ncbi:serine/threonine-protein kinase [Streptomyces synnematoformans]|uniref:non-specific serine/threonine protein kinase n=1 Tax=Streptomyces synnematoformans TaxID=415721 RepID=A0ABP5J7S1_9ACTN
MRGALLGDRYQLREPLGAGGMGTVWKATDRLRQRSVAVKTLTGFDGADSSELARRFQREIRAASLLRDPHIVEVHDSGECEVDGRPVLYLVMEEVAGEPLNRLLGDRDRPRTLTEISRWGDGICAALEVMHRAGIVHRDLKPANVMIGPDGHATVLDFGIARLDSEGVDLSTLTHTGHVVGTFAYMSPEQAQGTTALDGRSDLYSLGCLLYAALTGRPPFTGSWQEVLSQLSSDELPSPPSTRRDGIPAAWDDLVRDLLAKEPADRPPDATTVRERIAALPVAQIAPPPPGTPPTGTVIDPDAITADAADVRTDPNGPAAPGQSGTTTPAHPSDGADPPTEPPVAPTRPLPASPFPPPRFPPGDEVVARSLTGSWLLTFATLALMTLTGLTAVVLVVSGNEADSSLMMSALGIGVVLFGGLAITLGSSLSSGSAATRNRRTARENARSRQDHGPDETYAADEQREAARGAGSPAQRDALAAVTRAMRHHQALWLAYEFEGAIWWIRLYPLRFEHGILVGLTVQSRETYRIADYRLRGTSAIRPPGV